MWLFFFILMPTIAHGDYFSDIIIIIIMYWTRWRFRPAMFVKRGFSIILIIILFSLTTLTPPVPYRLTATRPPRLFYFSDATSRINIMVFTFAEIKRNNFLSTRSNQISISSNVYYCFELLYFSKAGRKTMTYTSTIISIVFI